MRISKNDLVVVLCGSDRGKKSRVIAVDKSAGTVKVEGVRVVHKHVRRSRRNPQGGRLSMEMSIPLSNVQIICPACGKPTRIAVRYSEDGAKYRVCKKCKGDISLVSPARN